MDTSPHLPKLIVPNLTPRESTGLQDYWRIHELHRDEIDAELWRLHVHSPVLI